MKRISIFSFITVISLSAYVTASPGRFGVTLGNPWFGLKYSFSESVTAEVRTGIEPGINVTNLRLGYNLVTQNIFTPYIGLDYGSITFKDGELSGSGYLITALLGEEFSILPKLSLSLDIGYSTISLQTGEYSISGPEWIFNLGINYYFILIN